MGNNLLVATPLNLDHINRSPALMFSSLQEMKERLNSDHSKHLVAKESLPS